MNTTEIYNTVIEFVSAGSGAATDTGATADPLFAICVVLIAIAAIGVLLFLYARRNMVVKTSVKASHAGLHARPSKATQVKGFKFLIAAISIILAAACFTIVGHHNALAQEYKSTTNGIATISDKISANVDDAGEVTLDKGVITNNDDVLAIGVRQVKSDSDADLSDVILTIICNETVLYQNNLGENQLNDKYTSVKVNTSSDLYYAIKMPAAKAKELIGSTPIKLSTKFP